MVSYHGLRLMVFLNQSAPEALASPNETLAQLRVPQQALVSAAGGGDRVGELRSWVSGVDMRYEFLLLVQCTIRTAKCYQTSCLVASSKTTRSFYCGLVSVIMSSQGDDQ